MDQHSTLTDEDRRNLVAYLDGELDDESARTLDVKLASDPAARAEVESLKKTWELLDYLPRVEPSASFTHRTIERLQPVRSTMMMSDVARRRARSLAWGLGWAASILLAACAGYFGTKYWQKQSRTSLDQELVQDLRVIENKRFYDHVDDLDFLKELDHPDLFGDDRPDM
jgi:hypothetical protein